MQPVSINKGLERSNGSNQTYGESTYGKNCAGLGKQQQTTLWQLLRRTSDDEVGYTPSTATNSNISNLESVPLQEAADQEVLSMLRVGLIDPLTVHSHQPWLLSPRSGD